jgi:hypothetical protein
MIGPVRLGIQLDGPRRPFVFGLIKKEQLDQ